MAGEEVDTTTMAEEEAKVITTTTTDRTTVEGIKAGLSSRRAASSSTNFAGNIFVKCIPLVTIVLRSQYRKWLVGLDLSHDNIEPVVLYWDAVSLHQIEAIVVSPFSTLNDPKSRLVLSIRTVHPTVQFLLRRGNVQIQLLGNISLDCVNVIKASTP
eukprot:CAMPEP_0196234774 /NCGR_PEP_ID=MMETSP0913-20130531/4770_1 /TAXON_ID=49265 /ORGANISM="Thalassiosira rotula, Strain GSO102" /LENGTH=156 /DNA_ID=CAMNT_0041515923 /DNA_START=730 /DNA_END=1197 /DNA_ORIENTATION=+